MRKALVFVIFVGLGACAYVPGTSAYEHRKAQEGLAQVLGDNTPITLRYLRGSVMVRGGEQINIVCGDVAVRGNSQGFTGFTHFITEVPTKDTWVDFDTSYSYSAAFLTKAKGDCRAGTQAACAKAQEVEQEFAAKIEFRRMWSLFCKLPEADKREM